MVHSISILGSTGSIGRQTVAVAEHLGLNVRALTTNRNIQLAEEQARRLHPAFVAVTDEASAKALRIALACVAGLAVLYAVGVPYMALILNGYMGKGMSVSALLWAGMLPFLPGDAIKIAVTAVLCPLLRKRIISAR